jgi:flavin reductase (DIM6/NTAB) family NADH-FMN oxidoreductase RutF
MSRTAVAHAPEVDEFQAAGLSAAASTLVDAPHVGSAAAVLECRLVREVALAPSAAVLVIGRVVAFRLDPDLTDLSRISADLASLPAFPPVVGHLHEDTFVLTRDPIISPIPEGACR